MRRNARRPMPPLNKTDLALLKALDAAVACTPILERDAYLMARNALELRLRSLCQLADTGMRALHVRRKEREALAQIAGPV